MTSVSTQSPAQASQSNNNTRVATGLRCKSTCVNCGNQYPTAIKIEHYKCRPCGSQENSYYGNTHGGRTFQPTESTEEPLQVVC